MSISWPWIWWIGGIILGIFLITLLIVYVRGFFHRWSQYKLINLPSPKDPNFAFTIASLSDSFLTQGKVTQFWVGADQINAARLEAIKQAKESIQFETFVMTQGSRAADFASALKKKASSGVRVQLIADSYGAKSLPKQYWRELEATGVEVRFFNKFTWRDPFYYLRRNHRKLLLIDQEIVLIGGAGVSNYWDGLAEIGDTAPWLDYEVCLEGLIVSRLKGIFLQHWLDTGGVVDLAVENLQPYPSDDPTMLITSGEDPSYRDSGIRAVFQSLICAAQKRIWILSPYFLPSPNTRKLLDRAKRKGIDVRIITMSVRCDKRFVYYTARELYEDLFAAGVEIYEYQPSMMHAKVLLIDERWVSFGSANFDPRSFFENDELNLATSEPHFIRTIETFFHQALTESKLVTRREWQRRPLRDRLLGRFWLLFYWLL